MKTLYSLLATITFLYAHPQSTAETAIKAGELILGGFSILKSAKAKKANDSSVITSVCVKNKLPDKITFTLEGEDAKGNRISRELVVQNDGKECVFNIPKGIYTYTVVLSNKDIYKKGEYKFEDDVIITIKKEE